MEGGDGPLEIGSDLGVRLFPRGQLTLDLELFDLVGSQVTLQSLILSPRISRFLSSSVHSWSREARRCELDYG